MLSNKVTTRGENYVIIKKNILLNGLFPFAYRNKSEIHYLTKKYFLHNIYESKCMLNICKKNLGIKMFAY